MGGVAFEARSFLSSYVRVLREGGDARGAGRLAATEDVGEGDDAAMDLTVPDREMGEVSRALEAENAGGSRRPELVATGEVARDPVSGIGEEVECVGRTRELVTSTIAAAERRLCVDERILGRVAATGEVGRDAIGVPALEVVWGIAGSGDGVREIAGSGE